MLLDKRSSVTIEAIGQRLSIRLAATHFFDTGNSALRPEALPVLDAVANELKPLDRPIQVEGHTDSAPLGGTRFRSNWDLSASRAATVVAYLEAAHEIKGSSLSAVGRGSTHPLSAENTAEGREINRRIEMIVELADDEEVNVAPTPR